MYFWYLVIALVASTIILVQITSIVGDHKLRKKMKSTEKNLEKAGIHPFGSTLSHGMYVNKKTRKIKADQKHSTIWYKRLS